MITVGTAGGSLLSQGAFALKGCPEEDEFEIARNAVMPGRRERSQ
jgi:hypothetical protein